MGAATGVAEEREYPGEGAAVRLGVPPKGEGAAVRLGVPPEGGGSCRRLVALRARRFGFCLAFGPPPAREPLCGWEFRRKAGDPAGGWLPCGRGGLVFVWRLGRLRRGSRCAVGSSAGRRGILPEVGCPAGTAVWFLSGVWAASGEGAAVRLGVPPEGGGSCRRLVALRARRFSLCRYLGRLRRGQGAKGGAAPPLRPPTPPITPRFPKAAPPCSARLGRAACATAPLMPGATTAGPTAPIFCRVPCPASFVPSQVLRAFVVSGCLMLVGRQSNCVRRGWGVPLRDHTPLCRAQRQ